MNDVQELFFEAMASLASGVAVITARKADGHPCGLAATSVVSYSAHPPSLLAAMRCEIDKAAYGEPNSLAILARTARRYVEHQHRHSRWEELVIFRLARRILSAQDDRAVCNGFRRLDELWGRSVAKVARSLAEWLDQRHELVPA